MLYTAKTTLWSNISTKLKTNSKTLQSVYQGHRWVPKMKKIEIKNLVTHSFYNGPRTGFTFLRSTCRRAMIFQTVRQSSIFESFVLLHTCMPIGVRPELTMHRIRINAKSTQCYKIKFSEKIRGKNHFMSASRLIQIYVSLPSFVSDIGIRYSKNCQLMMKDCTLFYY